MKVKVNETKESCVFQLDCLIVYGEIEQEKVKCPTVRKKWCPRHSVRNVLVRTSKNTDDFFGRKLALCENTKANS